MFLKKKLDSREEFWLQYHQFLQNWYSLRLYWWQIPKTQSKDLSNSQCWQSGYSVQWVTLLVWLLLLNMQETEKAYRSSLNIIFKKSQCKPWFHLRNVSCFQSMEKCNENMINHCINMKYILLEKFISKTYFVSYLTSEKISNSSDWR